MLSHLRSLLVVLAIVTCAVPATAQVSTGSIIGVTEDTAESVMPGVTIVLSGDRVIGGTQTQVSDTTGNYRFERLLPGTYHLKFSVQGFKTIERRDIIVSASFTATVNVQMDVGNLEETVTVTGASPTVDVKSNLQQTVMNQEILEGVPTGRDPWSLAKIIPGVQVATYDVGGNQAMQQSALRVHGARDDDKNFAIDARRSTGLAAAAARRCCITTRECSIRSRIRHRRFLRRSRPAAST